MKGHEALTVFMFGPFVLDVGRRWLKHEGIDPETAMARGEQVHEKTWPLLRQYRQSAGEDWWNGFVQRVLGRPSALKPEERGNLTIIAE